MPRIFTITSTPHCTGHLKQSRESKKRGKEKEERMSKGGREKKEEERNQKE